MSLIPNKNFVIISPLSKQEVIEKFRKNLKETKDFGLTGIRQNSSHNYEGAISKDAVVFRRILKKGANSFIPKMTVTLSEIEKGTSANFNARLNKFVEIFLIIFHVFFIGIIIFILLNSEIKFEFKFLVTIGQPILMLLFANGFTRIIFSFEVYRLYLDFRTILISEQKMEHRGNWLNRIIANSILGI